jgi:hypothetical protein
MGPVPSNATVIIIPAVLTIEIVPGMGQIDGGPRGIIEIGILRAWNILPNISPAGIQNGLDPMGRGRNVGLGRKRIRRKLGYRHEAKQRDCLGEFHAAVNSGQPTLFTLHKTISSDDLTAPGIPAPAGESVAGG